MTQLTQDERIGNSLAIAPITEGRTELAIKDDDGNEHYHDLDELRSRDGILDLNQASMNIDNSNDVIVGPVTQFYAPVTIIQSPNGQVNPTVQNGGGNNVTVEGPTVDSKFSSTVECLKPAEKPGSQGAEKFRINRTKYIIYSMLMTLIISIIIGIIYLIISINRNHREVLADYTPAPLIAPENVVAPKFEIIERNRWKARKPRVPASPLAHPVQFVIIKHTGGRFAKSFDGCTELVRNLQTYFLNNGESDIGYNFLICGDENVYVGRGWDYQNLDKSNAIDIVFIGTYTENKLTDGMQHMAKKLMYQGVQGGKLAKDYTLIAHSQTKATASPGKNIYDVIKGWEHFDGTVKL